MMAISTYAELQTSVGNWLNRQDLALAIPDFITLGEAHLNRTLRVKDMENYTLGTSTDAGMVPVPADFVRARTLALTNPSFGRPILAYVGEEEWDHLETQGLTGTPRYYTIINGFFQILPAPSGSTDYTLRYYGFIPTLSDTNTANWLLTKSPDLYLYASLLGAEAYLKDDDRLPIWKGIRDEIIADMNLESEGDKRPATRLVAKRMGYG